MTLKELSDQLGLSMTTVSRALNGHSDVAERTRDRVQKAATQAGYVPNLRARALATGRAMAIGCVLPQSGADERVNPIFADFLAGAGETFSPAGFDILISLSAKSEEERTYRDMAARRAVDGVIVNAPKINDPRVSWLKDIGLPFVVHGRSAAEGRSDHPWIDVNNTAAFQQATKKLISLGHTRIALVNGREDADFAQRRRKGYLKALTAAGISHDPALMSQGEMTEMLGFETATRMLDAGDPPTAFLTASIIIAIGVRRAINDRGLVCPGDVSILTFDDDLSYFANPTETPVFAAMKSSVREAGHEAAALLIDLIEGRSTSEDQRLLTATYVDGQSIGRRKP